MHADAAPIEAENGNDDDSERRYSPRTRLLSLDDLDRRTRAFQTAHDMKRAIVSDLGGEDQLSTLELIQAENAAVDAAVLRDLQVRWLRGDEVEAATLATIENVFNRTAAALGTKRRPRDAMPTLTQFVDGIARQEPVGEPNHSGGHPEPEDQSSLNSGHANAEADP